MFNIGGFFNKIQNVYTRDVSLRTVAQQTIKENIGIDIPIEKITYEDAVLKVDGISQSAKMAIFMKKQKILESLKATEYFSHIKDLR